MITPEKINENWETILKIINETFNGKRKDKLLKLFNDNETRLSIIPASSNIKYYRCYPGGLVDHILTVLNISKDLVGVYSKYGKVDFTSEELFFVVLTYGIGKMGDLENDYFIKTNEQWKIKRGFQYDYNEELPYMHVSLRSLFILQEYGIKLTENEYFAIYLYDGLFSEKNKSYIMNDLFKKPKSNLHYILSISDLMAVKTNQDNWLESEECKNFLGKNIVNIPRTRSFGKNSKKKLEEKPLNLNEQKEFSDLFGDFIKDS